MAQPKTELPTIISGPIIRRLQPEQMTLWLVTSEPLEASFVLYRAGKALFECECAKIASSVKVGTKAYIHLIHYKPEEPLPTDTWLEYDLIFNHEDGERNLHALVPELLYPQELRPGFVIKTQIDQILHGSCRKPHYPSDDALLRVDEVLESTQGKVAERPALLMMSGDQIYADDVAGPTLTAIHQVIDLLQLEPELIEGATVQSCNELYESPHCYYEREELLPKTDADQQLKDRFFAGAKKPIFTADTAHNHLITLSEVLAMYFLVWSPQLWRFITLSASDVSDAHIDLYLQEQRELTNFSEGLDKVQRALAHLPVYMIFDDHDVTDDWNLTRGWEEAAYGHPFSRSIIGNSLIGYWLCQGWGNEPEKFPLDWIRQLEHCAKHEKGAVRNELIDSVLEFDGWNYSLPTTPKLVVLDTRTKRWWSESSASKPSGLLDWEALSELQQDLMGEHSVLLVSPAPIYGMKLIEAVQRVFTYFGQALMVDAENWMAHKGSANVILNIFRHPKTPQNFVILSGDVHYSFVYDVKLRFRKNSPDIWQITCSGFKNEFPHKLLKLFDKLNRWLYGSKSPLNWFTKRRSMQIRSRIPETELNSRVLNCSAVGRVVLNQDGEPTKVSVLPAGGGEIVFPEKLKD